MDVLKQFVREILLEAKLETGTRRIPWSEAEALARELVEELGLQYVDPREVTSHFSWKPGVGIPVGSVRRMKSDIGDVDIIVTQPVSAASVAKLPGVEDVYGGSKQINFVFSSGKTRRKVNIFVFTEPKTFGAALLHTTGPQFYNIRIRNVAKSKGMQLSQNGLVSSNGKIVAGPTEAAVQAALHVTNREAQER